MKVSKMLSILLVLSMLTLATLTGCGDKNVGEATASAGSQTADASSAVQTSEVEDLKDMEISVANDLQEFDITKDEVAQKIYEKTKVKIKPITTSAADYVEQIRLWAATGSLPDVFTTYTVDEGTRFQQFIDQGVIRGIPEEMIKKYPMVSQLFENKANTGVVDAFKEIKGSYYAIPRPESYKGYFKSGFAAFYYRLDWAEKVGYSTPPKTTAQLADMLTKFAKNDPDENGKNDTYGFSIPSNGGLNTDMWEMFGLNLANWYEEDGKWIPAWVSQKNIEVLKWFRELYQNKVLDPEFAQSDWRIGLQKLSTSQIGAVTRNATNFWIYKTIKDQFGSANPQFEDPTKIVGIIPPVAKDENSQPQWFQYICTGANEINAAVSDEKLDRILGLMEYLLSDEAKDYLRYGVENVSYAIDKNGTKKRFVENDGTLFDTLKAWPSLRLFTMPAWDSDYEIEGDDYKEIKDVAKNFRESYGAVAEKATLVPRFLSTPAKDELTIDATTAGDKFMQIIVGKGDVEKDFNDFVNDCMNNKGLAKAVEEVTAEMAKHK